MDKVVNNLKGNLSNLQIMASKNTAASWDWSVVKTVICDMAAVLDSIGAALPASLFLVKEIMAGVSSALKLICSMIPGEVPK